MSEYDPAGVWIQDWATMPDFRSVFTKGDGVPPLYARAYSSPQVLVWNGAAFVLSTTLTGYAPGLGSQGVVVWDPTLVEYLATTDIPADVHEFDAVGNYVQTTVLAGFGGFGTEAAYPQGRSLAVTEDGCWLTYDQGHLSSWDRTGARVDTTTLTGAGTSFDSYFSLSFAQGLVWVVDVAGGTWRGYDVGI